MRKNGTKNNTKNNTWINLVLMLLLAVLFVVVYTYILQINYSHNTLEAAVESNIQRADAIYATICMNLSREDYTEINATEDMDKERYQSLQKRLNEVRNMKSVRYLYTAKREADGTLVYVVDGLDPGRKILPIRVRPLRRRSFPTWSWRCPGNRCIPRKLWIPPGDTFSQPVIRSMTMRAPDGLSALSAWKWIWNPLIQPSKLTMSRPVR